MWLKTFFEFKKAAWHHVSSVWFKMPFTHVHINLCATRLPCCFSPKKKSKTTTKTKQFSLRCKTILLPSVFNMFQIDFFQSCQLNEMCNPAPANRYCFEIEFKYNNNKNKYAKFTIRHSYAPKSIEGDFTQNTVKLKSITHKSLHTCCDCKSCFSLFPFF